MIRIRRARVRAAAATLTMLAVIGTGVAAAGSAGADVDAGRIEGTVTDAAQALPVAGIQVLAFTSKGAGLVATSARTDTSGHYVISDVPGDADYIVCFNTTTRSVSATSNPAGSPEHGYAPQCSTDVAWQYSEDKEYVLPAGATPVYVAPDGDTSGVDAQLSAAGAVTITVAPPGGTRPKGSRAELGDAAGHVLSTALASTGSHTFEWIAPGEYTACVDAVHVRATTKAPYAYQSMCSESALWTAPEVYAGRVPADATPFTVDEDESVTTNVQLGTAAGISGTARASDGEPITSFLIEVYDHNGRLDSAVTSYSSKGHYRLFDADPDPLGLTVCILPTFATGGPGRFGYVPQCFQHIPWSPGGGMNLPDGTTPVPTASGTDSTGIDFDVTPAGEISGVVTDSVTGAIVHHGYASVFAPDGQHVAELQVGYNGRFTVPGLARDPVGYVVCVAPSQASYRSECYDNVPWSRGATPPAGATPVPVGANRNSKIAIALDPS